MQNKANFQGPQFILSAVKGDGYEEKCGLFAFAKTKPIPRAEIASSAFGLLAMTGTAGEATIRPIVGWERRTDRAKQSQFPGARNESNVWAENGL
jgi:hypothetical protein